MQHTVQPYHIMYINVNIDLPCQLLDFRTDAGVVHKIRV